MLQKRNFYKKGFSLSEIMIAIALLGVVIVVICGVFIHGLDAIKKGKYRATALHLANQQFATFKNLDLGDTTAIPIDRLCAPPAGYIDGYVTGEDYGDAGILWDTAKGDTDYAIYGSKKLSGINYKFRIKIEGYDINLKKITVKVTWQEAERERNIELCELVSKRI